MTRKAALLALSLTPLAWSQTYPPDGAHMLGRVSEILLQWDLPGKEFQLTVQGSGRPLIDTRVQGRGFPLTVRPGVLYRWMVSPLSNAPDTGWNSFQFSSGDEFRYAGKPAPPDRRRSDSIHGLMGLPGGDGPVIDVDLQPSPAGVVLSVQNRKFLLVEGAPPVVIEARGGQGGPGGAGEPGLGGTSLNPYDADGRPGGDGGQGGPGGRGGTVRITSHGLPVEKFLQVDVRGGPGGPGGSGGRGGLGAVGYFNNGQPFSGRNGRNGTPGRPGPDGPEGSVQVR